MVHNKYCSICNIDIEESIISDVENNKINQGEEVSFAALLALVPAMTMTLFNLMGLI